MSGMCIELAGQKFCTPDEKRKQDFGGKRSVPPSRLYDWQEQVVGSEHETRIPLPAFATPPSSVIARIGGGGDAFVAESYVAGIPGTHALEESKQQPVSVRFRPPHAGGFVGELVVTASWHDGHVETHRIALVGRARAIDAAPAGGSTREAEPARPAARPDPNSEHAKIPVSMGLAHASKLAKTQADALGRAQATGVRLVSSEAAGYKKRREAEPLWQILAKQALLAGVEVLAPKIASSVVNKLAATIAADLKPPTLHASGDSAGVSPEPTSHAGHGVVEALGKGFGSSLKAAGKAAIEMAVSEQASTSEDPVVDFFESQQKAVSHMITETEVLLADREFQLAPVTVTHLPLAIAAMRCFEEALGAAAGDADRVQALATSQAWAAFKAREELGTEAVGDRAVTDMTTAREWTSHGLVPPSATNGVLDLHVSLVNGTPLVTSARINGISVNVATRLRQMDLRTANMPIRIIVDDGAYITRDEAGRIRASGAMHLLESDMRPLDSRGEAQAIRGAERIADQVLSQTLKDAKVAIETDDAGQKPGTTATARGAR